MVTFKTMGANAVGIGAGAGAAAFGKWAGFDLIEFALFAALMAVSIIAGALAAYSEKQASARVSADELKRTRTRMVGGMFAKYLLGMVIVYQIEALVWQVVLIGLVLGGGPVVIRMISEIRDVLGGSATDKDRSD